ncbi:MAG TPA: amino acid adenylation domain-containing protein, partial [Longimicrobium sp.]|nr:amino acid adenylation domain-containing protein [Longimicrobium sp.]
AYVPLDPDYPDDRLRHMVGDSAPLMVLAQASLAGRFAEMGVPVVSMDGDAAAWADRPETDPARGALTPGHLAYVIYTSGSTGLPKGVPVEHRSFVGTLEVTRGTFGVGPGDRAPCMASFAFDIWLFEAVMPLLAGAAVRLLSRERVMELPRLVDELRRATILHAVPALMRRIAEESRNSAQGPLREMRAVFVGGDAIAPDLLGEMRDAFPSAAVYVMYGPTEGTIICAAHPLGDETVRRHLMGHPLGSAALYVLDADGGVVPVGAPGEVYVGNTAVARGYLNRPGLTAERFVPDALSGRPGARLYRTGDLGRWLADGTMEFLGRNDHQVKIRGFRIELGEVEARLAEHDAVREAVVMAREDEPGDRRLVAYYVAESVVDAQSLRAHLAERLPEYMVPAAFVHLERLPLTPNAKLDRKALPAPDGASYATRGYEAPEGETEAALAEVWAEVLGVDRVGRHDNFFELGGHSLRAVTLIERMRRRGLHAEVRTLFTAPTLAELAAGVGGESGEVRVPPNRIPVDCDAITPAMLTLVELTQAEIDAVTGAVQGGAANVQDIYPLAPLQEGILFHHLLAAEGDPYLLGSVTAFDGRARLDGFLRALQAVVDRHDILRTAVVWEGLREPVQVVLRRAALVVDEVDLGPGGDVAKRLWARFDPRRHRIDVRQAPLLRAHVAHDPENGRWLLLLQEHHLISDHTTLEVLLAEVLASLEGRHDQLAPALPFRNFVAQARLGVSKTEHEAFFAAMLGDVEEPTAPFGLLDAWGDGSGVAEAKVQLDAALAARLRERARKLGVGAASLFHVAWAQVLGRAAGRTDVVFGTVLFGRMQGGEGADRVMGPFINTLPVRIRVAGEGVEATVRRTHVLLAGLLRHEHASLALAQRSSGVQAPTPLFSALLNYRHSALAGSPRMAGPQQSSWEGIQGLSSEERTNYPVLLSVDDLGEGFAVKAQVIASVGAERVCAMMLRALEGLADALEHTPTRAPGRVDVLPEMERRQVLETWNATESDEPGDWCMHELVEAQAARTPDALAVVSAGAALTYAELNARANRLAHHLRTLGVGPDARVAICMERGVEMVAGLLAVLKAGGAYVPLDPAYPAERLLYMLEDSAPAAVLTQGALAGTFAGLGVPVLDLDAPAPDRSLDAETNPGRGALAPDHAAYVIYTSGSTGRPKGVVITHRNAANFLCWGRASFDRDVLDRTLFATSLNFDLAVFECFVPLTVGASVHVVKDALALAQTAADVTLINTVPSAIKALVDVGAVPPSVHTVNLAGEPLKQALVEQIFATTGVQRVCNLYGPSETTTYSTWVEMTRDGGFAPHIGVPVANTQVYVLDAIGEPVPVGVAGELCIGGTGVARGYLNRPSLTAERFVPDPFGPAGSRLYRTGDLSRWLPAGVVEYLGRTDHQVKVRGFRIELGEIEARLTEHPAVRESVVIASEDVPGRKRLVAYYVADEAMDAEDLRGYLGVRLPEHMVPAAYVHLLALPLTPNGKLDRKALPAADGAGQAARGYEAPQGETEIALAAIWAEVLGVERVGRHDSFFELGGHSLLAVQIMSRARQLLGVEMVLGELFLRPVLADFARGLEQTARAELPPIEPVARGGGLVLSFAQQRLWFLEQLGGLGSTYHVPRRMRLHGALDRAALHRALSRIVARHEALRTVFPVVDGEPVQRIAAEESGFVLVDHDLRGHEDAAAELERLMADEAEAPFDLARGPLIRGRLVRLADDEHVLMITAHHVQTDGWSTGVFDRELSALYAAFARGDADPLPPLPVQYADYAAWQRRWVTGEVLRRQADYWTATMAGVPELLELPADRPRPLQQDHTGGTLRLELDEALTDGLKALARRHGATLFMTLLAGWAAVLSRLSGQDDVVIGTPTANRGRAEIEGLIGFFVNTLALRIDLDGSPTVAELLERVKARALEGQQHQDIPFEQVVELIQPTRSLAHSPLFQVMFTWENADGGALALPGIAVAPVRGNPLSVVQFDLSLTLGERDGRIAGGLAYATALYDRETAERHLAYLRRVLAEMVADERQAVDRLDLLPAAERALVAAWNPAAADFPADVCIHELFEAQAARTPDAAAVVFEGRALTYAELNRRANRLVPGLKERGVGPDTRVAVCLERGPEIVVAVLAVVKAGGAYVPLDPAYPADRLSFMVEDAAPVVVLTQSSLAVLFADGGVPVLELGVDGAADWEAESEANPGRGGLTPRHLAYMIYTSGSTGTPKGVMIEHHALVNQFLAYEGPYELRTRARRHLQMASFSFDVFTGDWTRALCSGGTLVLCPREVLLDAGRLYALMAAERIQIAEFVPAVLR